jgi:iron-sulfur cluster assembly accessory protein
MRYRKKPAALERLQALSEGPTPQLIRIGVRNKGCAGMSYHLDYVTKPERFDEVVEQDGVKVIIDSKALFSIIGSEMDWEDSRLASRFVFNSALVAVRSGDPV